MQPDARISACFAYCYLQHFQRLHHVGWWAGDLMLCSVWCFYEKCSTISNRYSFWWELAGIICANDSLSILQDKEHVFPVESRDTGLSRTLWTEEYGPYTKLPLKLEETGIILWWVGDEEEKEMTTGGFKTGLDKITCVVLQTQTSKSLFH